jgi:tRNA (guanine37-N1)-methyltransferase
MRVDIISVVPDLMQSPFAHSIMKRAAEKGLLEVYVHDLRQYSSFKHQQVDDYQFGGGAGMVMMCEPLSAAIEDLQSQRNYDDVIYMTETC